VVKPAGVTSIISEELHKNGRLELRASETFHIVKKSSAPEAAAKESRDAAHQCNAGRKKSSLLKQKRMNGRKLTDAMIEISKDLTGRSERTTDALKKEVLWQICKRLYCKPLHPSALKWNPVITTMAF
jgi:hypothetical protein